MRKYLLALFSLLAWNAISYAADGTVLVIDKIAPKNGAFVGVVDSSQAVTNVTNFNNNLSASDDTVQKALDTLDNMVVTGGGGGASTLAVGTGTASNFVTKITSPTAVISALGTQFSLTTSGTTSFWALNPSSVTLLGPNAISISSVTANYITLSSVSANYLTLSSATATYFNKSSVYVASVTGNAAITISGTNNTAGAAPVFSLNSSSATLKGNTFNSGSNLLQLSGGLVPNSLVDGSSVTKQGVFAAGSNITLTPGAGITTIAATTGNSGVAAGTYGSPTQVSSFTVGSDGRITGATNVTISLTNSNLQSGTYSNVTVPAANVAAGSLGASVIASSIAVNAVQDASIVGVSGTKITGTATIPNAAINGSSITKAGVLVAGSNITLTPGAGTTTISASGGGSGSSVYPATSTAFFPFGAHVSTLSVTDSQGGSNKARVFYNDFGAGGSEIHLNMDTGGVGTAEQLVIGSTNTSDKNIVFNGVNTGVLGFNDGSETLIWNKKLDVDQTLNVDGNVTFGSGPGLQFDSSVSSITITGPIGINSDDSHLRFQPLSFPSFVSDQIQFYDNSSTLLASIGNTTIGGAGLSSQGGITFQDSSSNVIAQFPTSGLSYNYFANGIHNAGGVSMPITFKTASFNASTFTYVHRIDATAGSITMTFPALDSTVIPTYTNLSYLACKADTSANTVSFAATGNDILNEGRTLTRSGDCVVWTSSTSGTVGTWFPLLYTSSPTVSSGGGGGTTIWAKLNGSALDNAVSTVNITAPLTATSSPSGQINIGVLSSSVTLQGNTFNTGANLVQLSGGLIPNSLISASSVTKQGVITAGSGISVTNGSGLVTIAATGSGITGSTTTISLTIDGQGSAIVAGSTRSITVPFQCVISSWSVVADASGSLGVHLASSTFSNYPTITNITGAGNGPSLSSQSKRGAAVSGWTQTTIDAGSVLSFVVDTASTVKWATIVLWVIR